MNYSNVHNLEKCRCAEEMCVISMSCQAQLTFLSDVTASQSGRDSEGRERGPGSWLNIYRVSQKKQGFVFRGHFKGLNGLKSKSGRKQTPIKIQFYLLGGVFSPVYSMYRARLQPVYNLYTTSIADNWTKLSIKTGS